MFYLPILSLPVIYSIGSYFDNRLMPELLLCIFCPYDWCRYSSAFTIPTKMRPRRQCWNNVSRSRWRFKQSFTYPHLPHMLIDMIAQLPWHLQSSDFKHIYYVLHAWLHTWLSMVEHFILSGASRAILIVRIRAYSFRICQIFLHQFFEIYYSLVFFHPIITLVYCALWPHIIIVLSSEVGCIVFRSF